MKHADTHQSMLFNDLGSRRVVADFQGGHLSSEGGVLLLRQIDHGLGVSSAVSLCFSDLRRPDLIEHTVPQLVSQCLEALALGYEDLNDHDRLRCDPLLALGAGKEDPLGLDRTLERDRGHALASPSTLNRLELSNNKNTRYHKISHDPIKLRDTLLTLAVRCLPKHARELVLDLDATGSLVHGLQEGRHFNTYYDGYCYLPLYIVCGSVVLWSQLRTSDQGAAVGAMEALKIVVAAVLKRCKRARIIIRGDAGFSVEELMAWCEGEGLYYCLGVGWNSRLAELAAPALAEARAAYCLSGASAVRRFTAVMYQTLESWSRERRVVIKAEVMGQGINPRFVVSNLPAKGFKGEDRQRFEPQRLYEELYCARGDMENVLKQQLLDLKADRLSTHYLASNQLRLWFATLAYLLVERLRALTLQGTELAQATVGTIRQRLLKVAAQLKVSVRRVKVELCSAFPLQALFRLCHQRLQALRWDWA